MTKGNRFYDAALIQHYPRAYRISGDMAKSIGEWIILTGTVFFVLGLVLGSLV